MTFLKHPGSSMLFVSGVCVAQLFAVVFLFVFALPSFYVLCTMSSVSLNYPFWIVASVFSKVSIRQIHDTTNLC